MFCDVVLWEKGVFINSQYWDSAERLIYSLTPRIRSVISVRDTLILMLCTTRPR